MCGIAGTVGIDVPAGAQAVSRMCERMLARGPDDGGLQTFDSPTPVVLGSRRLAIIDPSPAGHQPMSDAERGTTIVFNGMIYNFRELRARLTADGARFVSDCDTEVVLHAYSRFGIDCVRHLRGMFAFAVWDAAEQRLFLARDRIGIKPLYYSERGGGLLFASQVKALVASGFVEARLSRTGIASFLAFGAVSEPGTAIDGVLALPAASSAVFQDGRLEIERYWEPPPSDDGSPGRPRAAGELRELLADAVRSHLVSDAPIGVFLSGGLDSSALAALAARDAGTVRTVSVGFDDPNLSEERYSDLVARHIGSDHVRVALGASELAGWLSEAFDAMDQPSFDGINTYAVSRAAAATGLKVALSGLGADELLDGYGYRARILALERLKQLPALGAGAVRASARLALASRRTAKLDAWLSDDYPPGSSYALLRGLFVTDDVRRLSGGASNGSVRCSSGHADRLALLELENYLKNVLLRDTDSMSMASSLEVRVPYLDDPLLAWCLSLPAATRSGRGKRLLADAVADLLPPVIRARRKHGFLLPFDRWLRDDLAEEVEERLLAPQSSVTDLLRPDAMAAVWTAYRQRRCGWLQPWALYALCRWTESLR